MDQVTERLKESDEHVEDLAQLSTQITHRLRELNDERMRDVQELSSQITTCLKTSDRENRSNLNASVPPPSSHEQSPVPFMARVSQIYREQYGHPSASDSGMGPRFLELKKEHQDLPQQLQDKLNP